MRNRKDLLKETTMFLGKKSVDDSMQLEAQLEILRDRLKPLEAIVSTAEDSIFCKDLNLRYSFVNPAMERLLALPAAKILGHTAAELFHESESEIISEVDQNCLAGNVTDAIRSLIINDQEHIFHVIQAPIVAMDQSITGICGIVRDVTSLRRLEDKLREAQSMEAISIFTTSLAHELKNFLGVIAGHTSLGLAGRPTSSESTVHFQEIKKAAMRMSELIAHVLEVSQPSLNQEEVAAIGDLVRENVHFFRSIVPPGVKVRVRVRNPGDRIRVNRTQFCQIFLNLFSNALRAMGRNGLLAITTDRAPGAETRKLSEPGISTPPIIRIRVTDSGCGISGEDLVRIFHPFFTTNSPGKGTGLGLTVTANLVRRMNGKIQVQSKPGFGTTFSLLFPVLADELEAGSPVSTESTKSTELTESRKKIGNAGKLKSLLIVDDEPGCAELGKRFANRLGFRASTFSDPREALKSFSRNPREFSLVLAGLNLPHLPGDKLMAHLHEIRPDLPVILCSNSFNHKSQKKKFPQAAGKLAKPFTFDSLKGMLENLSNRVKP